MTIQQALKRGKWIRRVGWLAWFRLNDDGWLTNPVHGWTALRRVDILATDWEVKPKEKK